MSEQAKIMNELFRNWEHFDINLILTFHTNDRLFDEILDEIIAALLALAED